MATILLKVIPITLFLFLSTSLAYGQASYVSVDNEKLYDLLDELALAGLINYNSAIKPITRTQFYEYLKEAEGKAENERLDYEVAFYLKDFDNSNYIDKRIWKKGMYLYSYQDEDFGIHVIPNVSINGLVSENDFEFNRVYGSSTYGNIKNIGFYAKLEDTYESQTQALNNFISQEQGGNYKINKNGSSEFSEMTGGFTYAWKWGSLGLVKDHIVWGNNINGSNIFTNRAPSFTQIKLNLKPVKWAELNYFHGWLVSDVIDSSRSYFTANTFRALFVPKFIAANMLTIEPIKKLHISIGNSIVYSDRLQPAYLIPVFFYKSVDHGLNSTAGNNLGQNAQMFMDISSRNLKNAQFHLSFFIDEFSLNRAFNSSRHSTFASYKAGARYRIPNYPNVIINAEYTRTNPITYKHFISTTTFENNEFNLGNYLGDNSQELHLSVMYKPYRTLSMEGVLQFAERGANSNYTGGRTFWGLQFIEEVRWKRSSIGIRANYEILNNVRFNAIINRNWIFGPDKAMYHPDIVLNNKVFGKFGFEIGL